MLKVLEGLDSNIASESSRVLTSSSILGSGKLLMDSNFDSYLLQNREFCTFQSPLLLFIPLHFLSGFMSVFLCFNNFHVRFFSFICSET